MKYLLGLITIFSTVLFLNSCSDDDHDSTFDYHAHIHHPHANASFQIGDSLLIEVEFESHTNNTVHHVNVKIADESNGTVVYDKPQDAHVHETSGKYVYEDVILMGAQNGFQTGKTYKLTAKVWGHDAGEEEVISTVVFSVK
ncbi:MAG: hypothetical protein IPM34_10285 [Saprospiraceae bacterium]|nr:hypothetical protein [Saprospiraceae bacterium]